VVAGEGDRVNGAQDVFKALSRGIE